MNTHIPDWQLAQWAAGTAGSDLSDTALNAHLQECPACQQALAAWRTIGAEVHRQDSALAAPPLGAILPTLPTQPTALSPFTQVGALLRSQLRMVRSELWLATLLIVALGLAIAVLLEARGILYLLGPLVAAASAALVYGEEQDPAMELVLSTPVSQVQILLARLLLVVGYDLMLLLAANLVASWVLGPVDIHALITAWLAPLAFLVTLALFLSLHIGSGSAISVTYSLWLVRYVILYEPTTFFQTLRASSEAFWQSTPLLISAGLLLFLASLWRVNQARLLRSMQ